MGDGVYWRDTMYYTCTCRLNIATVQVYNYLQVHIHFVHTVSNMSCCIIFILSVFPHQSEAKSLTDAQSSVLSITEDEQGSHRPSGLKSPYRKIVAENERLRKELKKV